MAVRLTYIAIAIGGACGALAALVGSPSTPSETSPPLEGMNGLGMRPIGQIAAQASVATSSVAPSPAPDVNKEAMSSTATGLATKAATTPASASATTPSPITEASASAAPAAAAVLPAYETEAPPSDKESLLHSEMRCDQKDPPSCILAARAYEGATAGVTDAQKAEKYRKIALTLWISQCDHNSAASCATLAEMYRAGRGVPQNEKTAAALIVRTRELCRYNDAPACHSLPPQ